MIHPQIELYIKAVKESCDNPRDLDSILKLLHGLGASHTQAWIVLVLGYDIDQGKADEIMNESEILPRQDFNQVMHELSIYYHNGRVDSDGSVTIKT